MNISPGMLNMTNKLLEENYAFLNQDLAGGDDYDGNLGLD